MTFDGSDDSERLLEIVGDARAKRQPLRILGHGSKAHLLPPVSANVRLLSVSEHVGIEHYAPEELVVTVRAGTPLLELEQTLAQQHQMLAFEPPRFAGQGTVGGAVASGLAGPSRPWSGSVRDAVLGVEMINGEGERLHFGGQVMKNVAGYDLSRLQVGACGAFGVLLSVSLRVAPLPLVEKTYKVPVEGSELFAVLREIAGSTLPISAVCYDASNDPDHIWTRCWGSPGAVASAQDHLGEEVRFAQDYWRTLRDQTHTFYRAGVETQERLWCVSLPLGTPDLGFAVPRILEWGGARRWLRVPDDGVELRQRVTSQGGHLQVYGLQGSPAVRQTGFGLLPQWVQGTQDLIPRLREAFDPAGLFNGGHHTTHAD